MLESQKPMDEYTAEVHGINIITRNKMIKAFGSDNAKRELHDLIWFAPEGHFDPAVHTTLKRYWEENFNS